MGPAPTDGAPSGRALPPVLPDARRAPLRWYSAVNPYLPYKGNGFPRPLRGLGMTGRAYRVRSQPGGMFAPRRAGRAYSARLHRNKSAELRITKTEPALWTSAPTTGSSTPVMASTMATKFSPMEKARL